MLRSLSELSDEEYRRGSRTGSRRSAHDKNVLSLSHPVDASAQRRALLEALLHEEGIGAPNPPSIPRRASNDALPLSFAQQRIWFLDQFVPGSPAYTRAARFV